MRKMEKANADESYGSCFFYFYVGGFYLDGKTEF